MADVRSVYLALDELLELLVLVMTQLHVRCEATHVATVRKFEVMFDKFEVCKLCST
jgi:hypothetical protein